MGLSITKSSMELEYNMFSCNEIRVLANETIVEHFCLFDNIYNLTLLDVDTSLGPLSLTVPFMFDVKLKNQPKNSNVHKNRCSAIKLNFLHVDISILR